MRIKIDTINKILTLEETVSIVELMVFLEENLKDFRDYKIQSYQSTLFNGYSGTTTASLLNQTTNATNSQFTYTNGSGGYSTITI